MNRHENDISSLLARLTKDKISKHFDIWVVKFFLRADQVVGESGLELWFDRPDTPQKFKEPPFWKQVIIGVICVYPLVLFLNWALTPVMTAFPREVAILVNVVILSSLLTYPVMPWVTRLLRTWLYPK